MELRDSGRVGVRTVAALAVVLMLGAGLAGCGKKDKAASQTAARVNKQEITVHQINYVLQQQRGVSQEQTEAATRQILDRLIDQELAVQKAEDLKLDRDPRVVQQIEAAKREIIARAYMAKVGEAAVKPTAEEVKKYYDEKPALFSQRRVYQIQEVQVEAKPEQAAELKAKFEGSKNLVEFVEYLKANDIKFTGNQAVRPAEQLPMASLDTLAKMKDGDSVVNTTPAGLQVLVLAGSRSQPVDLERARPAIEMFLLNDRKRDLIAKDLKEARAGAKIEYVGKFAEGAQPAAGTAVAATAAVPASAPATDAAASGAELSGADVLKGLGKTK